MLQRLIMLPSAKDYASDARIDPLWLYYIPVIGSLYKKRVEMCLDLLPGGDSILEVGFGSGVSFLNLATLYTTIYGIDLNSDCNNVKACFAKHKTHPILANGSANAMPYDDATFDTVLLISILEHIKPRELDETFTEIHRVLKPGGIVVYGVPVECWSMTVAFRCLGYNIKEHHFSTEKGIFAAAQRTFALESTRTLKACGVLWPIYEARRFKKR